MEGTVGDDFSGDIAIDDLSFLGCQPYDGEVILFFFNYIRIRTGSVACFRTPLS